ncbi:MAG: PadR family transcriptional regulator [Candidatus Hodarchaeales archaeon]
MSKEEEQQEKDDVQVHSLTKLYTVLLLNSQESITGYRILRRLEEDLGKRASPTHVYDFLKELKDGGYIEDIEHEKSKRAKGFRITPAGEKFVRKILGRFDGLITVAIKPKLTICAHCGVQLYESFHSEKIDGKEMNFCCIHCASAYKKHMGHS